jgi:hypothetical protein
MQTLPVLFNFNQYRNIFTNFSKIPEIEISRKSACWQWHRSMWTQTDRHVGWVIITFRDCFANASKFCRNLYLLEVMLGIHKALTWRKLLCCYVNIVMNRCFFFIPPLLTLRIITAGVPRASKVYLSWHPRSLTAKKINLYHAVDVYIYWVFVDTSINCSLSQHKSLLTHTLCFRAAYVKLDDRLGSRLRGYHPVAPRPLR